MYVQCHVHVLLYTSLYINSLTTFIIQDLYSKRKKPPTNIDFRSKFKCSLAHNISKARAGNDRESNFHTVRQHPRYISLCREREEGGGREGGREGEREGERERERERETERERERDTFMLVCSKVHLD